MGSDHPNALYFSDLCRFKSSILSLARRASGDCQLLDAKTQLLSLLRQSAKPQTRKKVSLTGAPSQVKSVTFGGCNFIIYD